VAIILRSDGGIIRRYVDAPLSLRELQDIVGGYIQLVSSQAQWQDLTDGEFVVNEEGLLSVGMPTNGNATELGHELNLYMHERGIVGDVVLLFGKARMEKGE
jgi:hypothetical protein